MNDALKAIRSIVGPRGWVAPGSDMEPYLTEERGRYRGVAEAVARPATVAEVSEVMKLCFQFRLPVCPQGGNTGLVGGAVAQGGVLLSLDRMTAIRKVDKLNHTLITEAGATLAHVRAAAAEAGAWFALGLGAEGSCSIGGNLATNAGGANVLRYGNAREQTLGLEVVLADGRIWTGLRGLRKENAGYDLKQLFVGSEGTLGIITAANLKLYPHPAFTQTAFVAVPCLDTALALLEEARKVCGGSLVGFEVLSRRALDFSVRHLPGARDPFGQAHPWYVLAELADAYSGDGLRASLEDLLGRAFESKTASDAVLAESLAQAKALWSLREGVPEAQKHEGGSIKHDVAVPVSKIPQFVARATAAVEAAMPGIRPCPFGHLGDGNLHFNLTQPRGMDKEAFLSRWEEMNRLVHDIAVDLGGTFSAEHGVGLLKKGELVRYRAEVELDLMRTLKKALDPRGILNPAKVIDV